MFSEIFHYVLMYDSNVVFVGVILRFTRMNIKLATNC